MSNLQLTDHHGQQVPKDALLKDKSGQNGPVSWQPGKSHHNGISNKFKQDRCTQHPYTR